MRVFSKVLAILGVAGVVAGGGMTASSAQAAALDLFQSQGVGPFTMNPSESRQTHIEVLSNITITQFGAELDLNAATQDVQWAVRQSDGGGAFGADLFRQTFSLADAGLVDYDVDVNVSLGPGFYVLEMVNFNNSTMLMQRYDEGNEPLPFVVDGSIRVINGFANSLPNSILPSFSVTLGDANVVPVPATLPLLVGALGLLGFAARRRAA